VSKYDSKIVVISLQLENALPALLLAVSVPGMKVTVNGQVFNPPKK